MLSLDIGKEILEFLHRDTLINIRKERLIERINKHYPGYSNYTYAVVDELILVIDNNPQLIIDITKGFLTNKGNLTKIWDFNLVKDLKNAKSGEMISHKAKALASIYEMSSLFLLMVNLLNKQQVILKSGSHIRQILNHLQILGLTVQDREDLRIIRNATSHLSSFDGEHIIFEKGKVAIDTIDRLYYKMNDLMNWNLSIMIYSLFYIPKYGILVLFEIFLQFDKFNSEWQRYFDGVQSFFKTELEEVRAEKEKRKTDKKNKIKKTPEEFKSSDKEVRKFVIQNIELIADRWKHHVTSFASMLKEMHDKISTDDERKLLIRVSNWIRSRDNLFVEVRDQYKADPRKFDLLLFGREELII